MDVKNVPMDIFKQLCKLCGDIPSNGNFKIIDDVMKDIFSVLLLKLTFDNETQHALCNVCSSKVLAASNFKSTCIDTDNAINTFVDFENPTLIDIKEVYAKVKGSNHTNDMLKDLKICRLCFEPIRGEHWSLREVPLDSVQIFIPKINFSVTADPAFCSHCLDSLSVHSIFLKQCSDSQQEIDTKESGVADMLLVNTCVKTEEIEIKCEEIDEPGYTPSPIPYDVIDPKIESEESLEDLKQIPTVQSAVPNHKGPSEMQTYRCTACTYETKHKGNLKVHLFKHLRYKDPSGVHMYRCSSCQFETKLKANLKRHLLTHKEPSQVQMYKCTSCTYKTKYKQSLIVHLIRHKDPSEVRMHSCDKCDYKCKVGSDLRKHELVHKDLSKTETHNCPSCTFETKRRRYLIRHLLTHKDTSEMTMYKCASCAYETKYKGNLEVHLLRHKDPSEVMMYSCDKCEYTCKFESYLRRHQLVHKDLSEVQTYKCAECKYETKYRENFIRHQLTHTRP